MAGTDSRFSATKFRDGIRFAMEMGFPEDTAQQVTWQWRTERTFSKADSGGEPFTWTSGEVTSTTTVSDLIVDCAVKFNTVGGTSRVGGTGLGIFDTAKIEVTMLDTDWDVLLAHGGRVPDQAVVDNTIYVVQFVAPPVGLFDVTIYQIFLNAIDES